MSNNSLSGAQKIALQVNTLLLFAGCVYFILMLSSLSSYEVAVKHKDSGWGENKSFVGVSIKDKLTDGELCFGYECDVFLHGFSSQIGSREVGSFGKGDVALTEENLEALQIKALKNYKQECYARMIVAAILIAFIWFLRKWMRNKFHCSKYHNK